MTSSAAQQRLGHTLRHLQPAVAAAYPDPASDGLPLWDGPAPDSSDGGEFQPSLDVRLCEASTPCGAVLIMPGGGYGGRATDHEGYQIAERCNAAGFHAFNLQYRVAPNVHPAPLLDASRGIRLIRSHAAEWPVNPDQIAVLGFSAGGYLAASISTLHHKCTFPEQDDLAATTSNRPDATILCYPVISSGEFAHQGSFNNLLGTDATGEQKEAFSLEKQVDEQTATCFVSRAQPGRFVFMSCTVRTLRIF